jgi:membrane protein DedA with SNARE-associated domain
MTNSLAARSFPLVAGLAGSAVLLAAVYLVSPSGLWTSTLAATAIGLALSTLISEDLALVTAGALVAQGRLSFGLAVVTCIAGIVVGDVLLYLAGRLGGGWVLGTPLARRFVSPEAVERASQWMGDRTFSVVLLSRFTPGLRLPVYLAAGVLSRDFRKFSLALVLAAAAWTPLLVWAGGAATERWATTSGGVWTGVVFPVAALAAVLFAGRRVVTLLSGSRGARRLVGAIRRRFHWEFWPVWLSYVPVTLYIAWLGICHRSLTLFTAANPGIPCGSGFVGESKSGILSGLRNGGAPIGRFTTIDHRLSSAQRCAAVGRFLDVEQLDFPVVLKPNRGERGSRVAVIRSVAEMTHYLEEAEDDIIVQEYIGGREFGVFYYRFPNENAGHIFSITRKEFPQVIGDGKSTLEDLVLADPRAAMLASNYLKECQLDPGAVIPEGEIVPLIEIGAHCRGTVFLDGADLETEALRRAVDASARALPGFFFGRFDIRTPSAGALRQGQFRILELNGVTAEATHIYDPRISVINAYRTLFEQWRIAFEIGRQNRRAGVEPESMLSLIRMVRRGGTNEIPRGESARSWSPKTPIGESA